MENNIACEMKMENGELKEITITPEALEKLQEIAEEHDIGIAEACRIVAKRRHEEKESHEEAHEVFAENKYKNTSNMARLMIHLIKMLNDALYDDDIADRIAKDYDEEMVEVCGRSLLGTLPALYAIAVSCVDDDE